MGIETAVLPLEGIVNVVLMGIETADLPLVGIVNVALMETETAVLLSEEDRDRRPSGDRDSRPSLW